MEIKKSKWIKNLRWSAVLLAFMVMFTACDEEDYTYILEEDSNPPSAAYSYVLDGLAVSFTNQSEDAISYLWDFGDGSSSTDETGVAHTYSTKGKFTATLTVSDGNGISDVYSEEIAVGFPLASFTYVVDKKIVTFTNTSANASSYLWDFGDGNTSTEENPTHTYGDVDEYTVTLTAIDGTDENTASATFMTAAKLEAIILDWDHNVNNGGWNTVHCSIANSSDSYDLDDTDGKSSKLNDDDNASGDGDHVYQVVAVSPGEDYNLSFWVYQKHVGGTDGETGAIVGTIETVVNGGADRGVVLGTISTTATANKIWNNFNGDFNTGANSEVVIRLYYDYDLRATGQVEARVDYVEMN